MHTGTHTHMHTEHTRTHAHAHMHTRTHARLQKVEASPGEVDASSGESLLEVAKAFKC